MKDGSDGCGNERTESNNMKKTMTDELAEALRGMMNAFAWNVEKTVAKSGEDALQSDVKRARRVLAKYMSAKLREQRHESERQ
jgi:hypothetical protein